MRILTALCWTLILVLNFWASELKAQQLGPDVVSSERVDTNAYRTLFRHAILYKSLADDGKPSQDPKSDFRHLLAVRFGLSENDNTSLERLSSAYQGEIDPIHKQIVDVIERFHARFPDRIIRPGMDTTPPKELARLQTQEDKVTLRYRDLFRNSMREDAYQVFHARLLEEFGKTLKLN